MISDCPMNRHLWLAVAGCGWLWLAALVRSGSKANEELDKSLETRLTHRCNL